MSENDGPQWSVDRDSAPYWAAAREGRLELQRCAECDTWRFPARAICNRCHSFDSSWQPVSGRGRIVSWIVTHQPFSPAFADRTPYVLASVALDEQEDLVLLGNLVAGVPTAGARVRAVFPAPSESDPSGERRMQWAIEE